MLKPLLPLKSHAVALPLLALAVAGCVPLTPRGAATAPAPTAPPAGTPATAAPSDPELPKVRQAIREFMKEVYPGGTVHGVWTLRFQPNYCFAAADASLGQQRRSIDFLVRLYTRENGSEYWRAEPLDRGFASVLSQPAGGETLPPTYAVP